MPTGNFWDLTNPKKPVGDFDPNSTRKIPFDWSAWLTQEGTTYQSHTIIAEDPLEEVSSSQASGIITVKVKVKAGGVAVVGQKYALTCRLTAADGQIEDQTNYLKIVEK